MQKPIKTVLSIFAVYACYSITQANYAQADASANASLDDAIAQLSTLRDSIAEEKIPIAKDLNRLESEVLDLRAEADRRQRLQDARGLDINSLEADVRARQEEADYVSSLITEFLSSLETRSDPSELALYREAIDNAFVAIDNPELSLEEQFVGQLAAVDIGLERLDSIIGGSLFAGEAVTESGKVSKGTFALFGPTAYFSSPETAGLSMRGDTDRPVIIPIDGVETLIAETISAGKGNLPVDPTLGKALAIASTDETIIEHIGKGGVWIYPILFAALLSLAIALFKVMEIYGIKEVKTSDLRAIIAALRSGDKESAHRIAKSLPSPGGDLIRAGIENANEPKELLEEILLEKIVETQPKVERLLPIIAVTAATAPLLGLLGTVTGMINTFKLITIFGTGDAKSLSSGISEALITTEFGLIVAIPSLILHAILNRKGKAIMARMESMAMSFVNGISIGKKA